MNPQRDVNERLDNGGTSDEVKAILAEAEWRSERALAVLRLGAFVILLLLLRIFDFFGMHHGVLWSVIVYGLATAVALVLAIWEFRRPWLPWVSTALDVALVLHFMSMLVIHRGLTAADALAVPGTLMIFLILAQAAMRYRPSLIAAAAGIFALGWGILHFVELKGWEGLRPGHWRTDELAHMALLGLTAVALFLATARARALLLTSILEARLRASLSRFVPANLVEELSAQRRDVTVPRSQRVAILFVDMRGFTARAEAMPPAALLGLLSEYRRRMTAPVLQHGGMVDKFIGDAVMAVFGLPQPRLDDGARALRCGLAMLAAVKGWNDERSSDLGPPVRVSIGIHIGDAIVGAIGDRERLEYTVIGDTVNVAQRIERLSAESNLLLLVSAEVLESAGLTGRSEEWTQVPYHTVRGRQRPLQLYTPVTSESFVPLPGPQPERSISEH